ncbi:MAG: hypothetical protein PHF31_15085 [Methylobacter sp.]|nr:hypothetical protein [Methylobacter sp.]
MINNLQFLLVRILMPQLLHCLAVSQLFLLPIVFKAKGINKDLFGNEQAILSTPEVSKEMLVTAASVKETING